MIERIVLDIINLIFLCCALLICFIVLTLICLHIRPLISNVPILLICSTYMSLILTIGTTVILYGFNLYGDIYSISINDQWCKYRGYLVYCGYTALYYSCLLQSIFRLFRVVFYRQRILQSSSFFLIAIIIQWILSFILPLYNFFCNDYEYMLFEYRCWISFTNIRGVSVMLSYLYFIPLCTTIFIYLYLIRYVRLTNQIQQRRLSNERDMLVLKRIVMCVLVIIALGVPTTIIWFVYIVSSYVIPLTYHIQGLSLVIGLLIIAICFAFISPQIEEIFKKHRRQVLPLITMRTNTIQQQQNGERF